MVQKSESLAMLLITSLHLIHSCEGCEGIGTVECGLCNSHAMDDAPVTSLLSNKAILRHIDSGKVVIHPFIEANLSTSSYDVTLGQYYYREAAPEPGMVRRACLGRIVTRAVCAR